MPRVDSIYWDMMGRHPTGLPGSKRHGPFHFVSSTLTVGTNANRTIDPTELKNDIYDRPFFIEELLLLVDSTVDFRELWIQMRPSSSPAWTNEWVPTWVTWHAESVTDYTAASPKTLYLPMTEPYPLQQGESLQVDFWNRSGSASADVIFGMRGYYETKPAYTKSRKSLFIMGDRIATLADGASAEFDSMRFAIGFEKFVAQWMGIQSDQENTTRGGLRMRYGITGRNKIVETLVQASALKDSFVGQIPLYDTLLVRGEGFEIEVENRDGTNPLSPIDAAVIGYRDLT